MEEHDPHTAGISEPPKVQESIAMPYLTGASSSKSEVTPKAVIGTSYAGTIGMVPAECAPRSAAREQTAVAT